MPDGMDHLRHPPMHSNCRCMDIERSPIQAGDYVRYNGHIAQVTETRLTSGGEHVLSIEGGVIRSMQVACDRVEGIDDPIPGSLRAEVEGLQARIREVERYESGESTTPPARPFLRPALEAAAGGMVERLRRSLRGDPVTGRNHETIIADDLTEQIEDTPEARRRAIEWVNGVIDGQAIEVESHEGPPLEFTREGVEEWGRRQCDEITVEQELNRDHIDVIAHRDAFESVSRVSMFALHRARDPFLMLRVAAEAALGAVNGMRRAMGQATETAEEFRTVTQNVNFSPRFIDAESAARHLRDAAADIGLSAQEAVEGMGNMTRAMRQWEAQYTNRPGVFTDLTPPDGNTGYEVEQRTDAEYGEADHDFEDERSW